MARTSGPVQTFAAVLAALVVFAALALGVHAWQQHRQDARCEQQQFNDAISRDNGLGGALIDRGC